MTYKTLEYIHKLLVLGVQSAERSYEGLCAKLPVSGTDTEEACRIMRREGYEAACAALEEFENHDWR